MHVLKVLNVLGCLERVRGGRSEKVRGEVREGY